MSYRYMIDPSYKPLLERREYRDRFEKCISLFQNRLTLYKEMDELLRYVSSEYLKTIYLPEQEGKEDMDLKIHAFFKNPSLYLGMQGAELLSELSGDFQGYNLLNSTKMKEYRIGSDYPFFFEDKEGRALFRGYNLLLKPLIRKYSILTEECLFDENLTYVDEHIYGADGKHTKTKPEFLFENQDYSLKITIESFIPIPKGYFDSLDSSSLYEVHFSLIQLEGMPDVDVLLWIYGAMDSKQELISQERYSSKSFSKVITLRIRDTDSRYQRVDFLFSLCYHNTNKPILKKRIGFTIDPKRIAEI